MHSLLTAAPPRGWTLSEAAAVLFPGLHRVAALPAPEGWWMAGPNREPHKKERDELRLAFARLMETGAYIADGIPLLSDEVAPIPPHVWRIAKFDFGFPAEPELMGELQAGSRVWNGVRIRDLSRSATGTIGEETRLQAWLVTEIRASSDCPIPKDEMQVRAKAAGLEFKARAFDRAWSAAINETGARAWSLPGPRKSTRKSQR